jgi:lipoyl(octanoyl) transferase
VASLGISVSDWVTMHGLALNVSCDLGGFARINPCGLDATLMTSVEALGGNVPEWSHLEAMLSTEIARVFGRKLQAK